MPFAGRGWLLLPWLLPVVGVLWTVWQAPAWLEPRLLTVTLESGQAVALGRKALWAPQADGEHILLRREADGQGWRLTNLSPGKQVLWRPALERDDRPVREWPLRSGASFGIGSQRFAIRVADVNRVELRGDGQHWEYDGVRLRRNGQSLPECYPSWRTRWRRWLGELGLPRRLVGRPLRLGGGVYCADRLGLTGAPVDTALIKLTDVGFVLGPGEAGRPDGPPVMVELETPAAESLWRRSIHLAVGDRLIIGRTYYRVERTAPALQLAVIARAQRWPADSKPPDTVASAVSVNWQELAWLWPSGPQARDWLPGLALLVLALGLIGPAWRGAGAVHAWLRIGLALTLAGACLALYVNRLAVPVLWPYLSAWPALLIWLGLARSPWSARLLVALTLLLGGGLVTLLQLGIGGAESGWQRYGGGGAALAGAFGWLAWAGWNGWRWRPARWSDSRRIVAGLWLLCGLALLLLLMQIGFGEEGGWGGVQPFELTKLALVVAAAHALGSRAQWWGHGWRFGGPRLWLRYLGPLVLLAVVTGFALMFLHDFSPLVLLLLWVLALAWAWVRVYLQPVWHGYGRLAVVALALVVVAGLTWLHGRPEKFPLDFQADRIRVWAAPEQYPHAGYQLRRALEAICAGGWWGTVWNGTHNGRVMAIPAVEDDFTPAFFLNRYGGMMALVLAGIQAAFIAFLLTIANRALERAEGRGDDGSSAPGGLAYFTLYGGAALLGAHFLISWGTNLGFLPVMGQPMPLLSSAGSHLVLFVLPIVALAVAAEEGSNDNPF